MGHRQSSLTLGCFSLSLWSLGQTHSTHLGMQCPQSTGSSCLEGSGNKALIPALKSCPGWSLLLNGSSLLIFFPVTKSCSPHWPNWVVISQVRWLSSSGLAEIMHFFCCLFGNMFYNTWHVPLSLKSLLALEINQCLLSQTCNSEESQEDWHFHFIVP